VDLAGLSRETAALEREDGARSIAQVLRLEPEEWIAMSYRHVKGTGLAQRTFCGQTVRADQLNYRRPRLCPHCLRERLVWWAIWDLALVAACPLHRCLLINQCPACGKKLAWTRPAVERCRCGMDLRTVTAKAADSDLVAMNTLIYCAAGFSPGAAAELELDDFRFPPELARLILGPLLRLIRFVGLVGDKDRLRSKQRPFHRTDLITAIQADQAAIPILRDWPRSLREILKRMLPEKVKITATPKLADIFGNFYRHLFCVLPRNEFGFFHEAFETFVLEDWKGLIRGQHRRLSVSTRKKSPWMTVNQAEKKARIHSKRIEDLVCQRKIEGMFFNVRRGGGRRECWVKRASLDQWIKARDAELAPYMSRPEAQRALGLKNITVQRVAEAGLIRYVQGPERNFPYGFHFLREDILKIRNAFEKYPVPVREYSKPGELIALRHALKNYLGRDFGLPAVIRAVLDGALAPDAYTSRFPGITGYLFRSDRLRRYRPVRGIQTPPEGFLSYKEAASVLGVQSLVIRGLVARGIFSAPAGYQSGLSKLVPVADVQRFAERYVPATVLAKRFSLSTWSLTRYLEESGRAALAVPIPEEGRRPAFFILKAHEAQFATEALRHCRTRRSSLPPSEV
jgi:hypothetical protein